MDKWNETRRSCMQSSAPRQQLLTQPIVHTSPNDHLRSTLKRNFDVLYLFFTNSNDELLLNKSNHQLTWVNRVIMTDAPLYRTDGFYFHVNSTHIKRDNTAPSCHLSAAKIIFRIFLQLELITCLVVKIDPLRMIPVGSITKIRNHTYF